MKVKTLLLAFLTWLIPMAVSMLMYEPETNSYLPNMVVFKSVMLVLLFTLTFIFFNRIKMYETTKWWKIAVIFTIICSILDFAVLIGVFGTSISLWAMAIFPFYLLSFFGLGYFILGAKRKTKV